jgi:molecular chaperone DnaK (HSP70)
MLLDSYTGSLDENTSLEIFNLTATNWNPEPGKRNLLLRALDSRGIEFTSTEKEFDIRRNDWNVGLTGIELVGTGSNQEVKITTIRENQNLLNDADCLLRVTSEGYDEEYVMNPSGVYFLPKIDRPNLPDGNELIVRFSCAFPWDVESDSTDNEQRIILEGGSDNDNRIEDLETGIAAAALVIGLSVALVWLMKNHRERKEMMQITEKAIKQHLSNNKNNTRDNVVEEIQEKIEQVVEIVEDVIEDNLGTGEKDEEELDEFELRLRRLSK